MDAFVYGTLTDPTRVASVVRSFEFRGEAVLDGLHRVDGEYPTLAPGGSVAGRLLWTPDAESLDAYEGVERGLYVRVSVPLVGAAEAQLELDASAGRDASEPSEREESVAVYVGDPEALEADAEWPGSGPLRERVRQFCRENEVVVRPSRRG